MVKSTFKSGTVKANSFFPKKSFHGSLFGSIPLVSRLIHKSLKLGVHRNKCLQWNELIAFELFIKFLCRYVYSVVLFVRSIWH